MIVAHSKGNSGETMEVKMAYILEDTKLHKWAVTLTYYTFTLICNDALTLPKLIAGGIGAQHQISSTISI